MYIDPNLARRTRVRLAKRDRTMPWLLHQITSHYTMSSIGPSLGLTNHTDKVRAASVPHAPAIPMGLLPDWAISRLALESRMIEPFVGELVRPLGPSYGLGSAGYDIRLASELLIATDNGVELDSHAPNEAAFTKVIGDRLVLPPHGFALGRSVETYANEGITQVLFMRIPAPDVSYADRKGLYQGQCGITPARTR